MFLRGLLLGLVAGVPLGPASAAVFDTAARRSIDRAFAIGLGAALVDFVYPQLVVAGLATVFNDRPVVEQVFLGLGGAFLVVAGVLTARAPSIDIASRRDAAPPGRRTLLACLVAGVLIAALNPGLLASWVVMAGTLLIHLDPVETLVASAGIFVGTLAWFTGVAVLGFTGRVRLGHRVVWVTRGAGVLLAAYGLFLIGKLGVALAR